LKRGFIFSVPQLLTENRLPFRGKTIHWIVFYLRSTPGIAPELEG